MKISDTFTIQAPSQTVWDFLLDIERMSLCVPGVESIEALDESTYRGNLKVKVGPISARFSGLVRLLETKPPRRLVASLEAEDKAIASLIKGTFSSELEGAGSGTKVTYEMDVNLRGRLGQFGTAVTAATARKMTAQFADNLRKALEG